MVRGWRWNIDGGGERVEEDADRTSEVLGGVNIRYHKRLKPMFRNVLNANTIIYV